MSESVESGLSASDRDSSKVMPDLILLDLMIPDMDGFEVCKTVEIESKNG